MKPRSKSLLPLSLGLLVLLTSGCHHRHRDDHGHAEPLNHRHVTLEVEVYDPVTNYVWEDVGVRVVEAWVEASDSINTNPDREDWYFTDKFGLVLLGPEELAFASVGFEIDDFDRAVLSPSFSADEATVLLEVWAPGFKPVLWEVDLSWDSPDIFVQIPFGELALKAAGEESEGDKGDEN